ncbi:MAG: carboxylesterase family protein [Siphonobacter sp.]
MKKILSCLVFLYSCLSADAQKPVAVDGGLISGINQHGIQIFKGIPFAAAPVGKLRWKAPQALVPWSGVRACEAFGPSPMQASPVPFSMWSAEFLIPKEPISEDCLYLNVWSGAKSSREKRPVLVWIYGGGFTSGGSAVPIYDGEAMAKKGIVFVSINYRVGTFGFFAHPELTKESDHNASGNYGLMDQIAALKWVQRNIAVFGGDPANVTIAGQSAGAMSVNCLVASPQAKGLFKKAIAESGASFAIPYPSLAVAEEKGQAFMKALGVSSLEDLRSKSASEIMQKDLGMRGPILDGYILSEAISKIFAEKKQNDVALLTGWNEDEGLLMGTIKKSGDYQKQIQEQYGRDASAFLTYYPGATDLEATQSQLNLSRDMIFGAQNYAWATIQSDQGRPVYVYRFTRKVPGTGEYAKYGAFHTGEVAYAYDNLAFIDRPWQAIDYELAQNMSSYWLNFIISGNPNGKGLAQWPAYSTKNKEIIVLGDQVKAQPMADAAALDFLFSKMKK